MSLRTFIEPKQKVIVNIVVTFIQGASAVVMAAAMSGTVNKLTVGAATAAGLSAVWNLRIKPYLVKEGWLRG
ncbi:hypothetical protein [Mycobacteroides abscessus]|uniref:hypothetical protein n=1 Tax=Mycobacteroides abscessus TaxID=36809 RepID=UPI00092AB4D3|nr:hypothetical protein [Mycobacteroides abscessus]SIC58472.1 Uncharacterised protein [Mycobacteroides abscessus subsp. abscessus]